MVKITDLPLLASNDVDGAETLPVVKAGVTMQTPGAPLVQRMAQPFIALAEQAAASAEAVAGRTFETIPAGLAETIYGKSFAVANVDGTVSIFMNDSGTAVFQRSLATAGALRSYRGSGMVGFRLGLPGAILRDIENKVSETISVKDFGAVGDGVLRLLSEEFTTLAAAQEVYDFVTDLSQSLDWAGIQAAMNADVASIYFPEGRYRISENLVRDGNTLLHGDGLSVSILVMEGTSSFIFDGGAAGAEYGTHALQIERIGFEIPSVTTKTVISAIWSAGIGGTSKTFTMRDFQISAGNAAASFKKAIYLENARNVLIDNGRILGDRDGAPISAQTGIDIFGTDEGAPTEIYLRAVLGYYCQTMINIEGWVEGVNIDQCTAVNCHNALKAVATTPAPRPWIRVSGCHFNTDVIGIDINNFVQWIVTGNLFYATDFDAVSTGYSAIYVNGRAASMDSLIADNIMQCLLAGVAKNAIVVQAGDAPDDNVTISRNIIVSFDTGIVLLAGTNGVRVADDNDIRFCGSKVADFGSNLICIAEAFSGNGSKASLDGHVEKWGSSVVTLDANGNGAILFNKAFAVLLAPYVSNGDPTIAASAQFIADTTSSTPSALAFSVRPNPGPLTVRVNWRAIGVA